MEIKNLPEYEALGESEVFLQFQESLGLVAKVNRPVILIGERGTGKELAASRIHFLSKRWDKPFVVLNCAALPPSLIETELFGHSSGAYTGASKMRKGRFEEANGGTLFLDELGLIPMEVQEKILRVVEYGSFERVGSSDTIEVDVRLVTATNQDMPKLCEENEFKRDLLDRLSFEVLFLPPLRERGTDKLLLAKHFCVRMARELGKENAPCFSKNVIELINNYEWQGNIRELKNVIERAVYKCDKNIITELNLTPFKNPYIKIHNEETNVQTKNLADFKSAIQSLEINYIKRALSESQNNQKIAAKKLGLTYDQFRGLYKKYKVDLIGFF